MVHFNGIIHGVALRTGAVTTDLRQDVWRYEITHNTVVPGGLQWGILTTDTVHPCHGEPPPCYPYTHGNYMIANSFARGITDAVRTRERVQQ
jgi:hypothetical protein